MRGRIGASAVPWLAFAHAWLGSPGAVRADPAPADACFSAPVEAQRLQRDGKLIQARALYASCARNACPPEIVKDCARWMTDVDAATPSVVAVARDAQQRDALDARVSIDGQPASDVTARAIPLDPGMHKFVFQRTKGDPSTAQVLLREGEKNREVVATFGATAESPEAAAPVRATVERPVPAGAWIAGAIGAVGMASFATFGSLALAARGADHCDVGCTEAQKGAVDSKFMVANISLGVGVVGLGVATWLFLARPAVERPSAARVDVRSFPGGAVAVVSSSF